MPSKVPAVILVLVGLLELALAGVFLVVQSYVPLLRAGFVPTAVILGVTGVVLILWGGAWWRRAAEARRLLRDGLQIGRAHV